MKCNTKHMLHTYTSQSCSDAHYVDYVSHLFSDFSSCYSFSSHSLHASPSVLFPTSPFLLPEIFGSQPQSVLFACQDFTQKPNSTFCWTYFSHKISFTFTFVLTSILKSNVQTKIMKATFSQPERKADEIPRPPPIDSC